MNRGKYLLGDFVARLLAVVERPRLGDGTRVLMYHAIGERVPNMDLDLYSMSPAHFADQVEAIVGLARTSGTRFVPFVGVPTPGIAVTFDDGYRSFLDVAVPLLSKHDVPVHVFVGVDHLASDPSLHMSPGQVREVASLPGVTVGAHGYRHVPLTTLSDDELRGELSVARRSLEDLLGHSIDTMSYPHGAHDERVHRAVAAAGYVAAACSDAGTFVSSEQKLHIPRIDLWGLDSPATVKRKVLGAWDRLL
jgi:peptidoglycan/xylan/chitin deacetylase (PgdA/CDA1 family)